MQTTRPARVMAALIIGLLGAAQLRLPNPAALLLARIEYDAGRHEQELRHAYRLVRLAPREQVSLSVLRRATRCSGLKPPVQAALDLPDGAPDVQPPMVP